MLKPLLAVLATASLFATADAQAQARVTVGHFAPFAGTIDGTSVTVRVNGAAALENVVFGDFTDYIELPAGDYLLEVLPSGTESVAMSLQASLEDGVDYTVLATGNGVTQDLALRALLDDNTPPATGNIKLRVVHGAPFGATEAETAVSVRLDDGTILGGLSSVPFFAASDYLEVPAGTYDFKVSTPNGNRNLIDAAPVTLPAGAIITVVAVGDGINQPLGFVAIPVGFLELEPPVDLSVSGHWYNPAFPAQGFAFTPLVRENRLWGTWYGWQPDNSGDQIWFTLDTCGGIPGESTCPNAGAFDNRQAVFTVYAVSGGLLLQDNDAQLSAAGTLTVDFTSCTTADASLELGAITADFPLENLTPSGECTIP
jgi:hypothetical protein